MAIVLAAALLAATAVAATPKYVFLFIGDGMARAQIQAAEAYLATRNGGKTAEAGTTLQAGNRLRMTRLPVQGLQTTCNAHALITDSAAAGTALACGLKTANGVIGMDSSKTVSYKSIAQLAAEKGKRIGIISTVSLDNATPASFFASVPSREDMNAIGCQLADSGYDFFGGGGLAAPASPVNVWGKLARQGYTVLNSRDAILELKKNPKSKVVAINPSVQEDVAMPYAIDRPEDSLSLADMTAVAIASLRSRKMGGDKNGQGSGDKGFFLMVEGGKIDWACHANDARTAIEETLDLDDAIGAALEVYRAHPSQTLIVVTGDHETGGMSVGKAAAGDPASPDQLRGQQCSFEVFAKNHWKAHREANTAGYDWTAPDNLERSTGMTGLLRTIFGLEWATLNDQEKERLEDAYDKSMSGHNNHTANANTLLYGGHEPIVVTITRILNEHNGIVWTTHAHTGVPVPVFAIGPGAQRFAGLSGNTGIAKQMARAMGIRQPLPVKKQAATSR